MSVYKPSRSPYYAYDFQFQGIRHHGSTGCANERDALKFERGVRRDVTTPKAPHEMGEGLTVDGAFGLWWQAVGNGLKSCATVEYQAAALVKGLGATSLIPDLTLRDFDAYRTARRRPVTIPAKTSQCRGKVVLVKPAWEKRLSEASVNREIELARRVIRKRCSQPTAIQGMSSPTALA